MDLGFPKEQRICLKKDIASLLASRDVIFKYPLRVTFRLDDSLPQSRAMFTVPKRNFKRAVKRNLLKRRMREAFRLNRDLLGDSRFDFMFVYIGKEESDYGRIEERMRELFTLILAKGEEGGGISADPAR